MKLHPWLVVAVLVLALPLPAARAATVSVDGPSANIDPNQKVDVDVAPDGTGGVAYLKKVGSDNHVYVSRFVGGAFQPAERVDPTLTTNPSGSVFISAANGGKLAVAFVNGAASPGNLHLVFRPSAGQPWTSPTPPFPGVYYGRPDLAPGGNGYLAVVSQGTGGDASVQRITGTSVSPLPGTLEQDVANDVPNDNFQRPIRVATLANGDAAVVAFTEQDGSLDYHVTARRITGDSVGPAQVGEIASLNGTPAASTTANDMVDLDVDGTGRAWVSFRENFATAGNRGRALVRPLVGSSFGAAQVIDALPTPPPEAAEFPRIDVNSGGLGLAANTRQLQFGIDAASLAGGTWSKLPLSTADNGAGADPVAALAETGAGLVAWKPGAGAKTVVGRIRTSSGFGSQATLSNPAFGAVTSSGLEAAADNVNRAVVAFIQGTGADARVVAAVVNLPKPLSSSGGSGGGAAPLNAAPSVTKLKVNRRIRKTRARPRLIRKRKGSTISFSLSEDATVTLSFERKLAGRRVGGRCVTPKPSNRRARSCKRYKKVRTAIKVKGKKGVNRLVFKGRLSRRGSLKPGSYRLSVVARDDQAAKSQRKRASFRLLRAKKKRPR